MTSTARTRFRPLFTLVALVLFVGFAIVRLSGKQDGQPPGVHLFAGQAMGTSYHVKVVAADLTPAQREALDKAIAATIEEIEAHMSTWQKESEISRFNRSRSTAPQALSPMTRTVVAAARKAHELTRGAFDPTVGPLVDAWGFGPEEARGRPAPETIAAALDKVGLNRVTVDPAAGTIAKEHPEMALDLSGIAKGFGVDEVARCLEEAGYHDFMVEIGGEIVVRGQTERGGPFRIAVERPEAGGSRDYFSVLTLTDRAVATSGDYRNYREIDGSRFSHTIDPRTGEPITHRLASVTVVAETCMAADALATGLNVLGPEAGWEVAEANDLAAQLIIRTDDGYAVRMTSRFEALLAPAGEAEEKNQP